jgi:hypothetical protein
MDVRTQVQSTTMQPPRRRTGFSAHITMVDRIMAATMLRIFILSMSGTFLFRVFDYVAGGSEESNDLPTLPGRESAARCVGNNCWLGLKLTARVRRRASLPAAGGALAAPTPAHRKVAERRR